MKTVEEKMKKLAKDLITISELAMPDTYFQSDSRVNFARKVLKELKNPPQPKEVEPPKEKLNLINLGELEKLDTRSLMTMLNSARRTKGKYYPNYGAPSPWGDQFYTISEIKAILADRPHVPNKQEEKEIRRKKAQGKL